MICTINMEKTGNRIRELRQQCGYTVKDLQKEMGLSSFQAIYKWQRGEALPSVDNLMILAGLFQVRIDQIIIKNE